jgi:hypothetical protein
VELTFPNPTIVTRLTVRAPIVRLLSVTQTPPLHSGYQYLRLRLRCLDLLGPTLDHPRAVVDDEVFLHMRAKA